MQSVPYFPTNFLSSPYPTTTATTTTTSPPENGSTVMTMTNPPLLSSPHGMTEQTIPLNGSSAEGTKRNQVKNACTNCQKACKKCDDARPCPRCVKYNIALTCVNSVRKERKKGIKRGPYKRRQKSIEDSKSGSEQPDSSSSSYVLNPAATPTTAAVNPGITAAAVTSGANPADYGYPSNLTQYSQSFDPYQFAAANVYNNKEQHQQQQQQPQQQQPLSSGVYIVNPGYPGYPIVNGEGTDATSTTDNANNGTQSAYFTEILQHINANNAPLVPGVYYPTTESSTPADQDKHQPTTPVPSTSNSSGTTSPSETAKEDDDSKFARLTQLCSAALRENKEAEDAAAAAAAAAAQAVQTAKAEDN